jgi:hypothetical protein
MVVVVDEPGDDCQSIIAIPMAAMACPSMRRNTSHCSCNERECPQRNSSRKTRRSTLATASCWMLFFASTFCWVYQTSSSHSRAAASFQPHRHPLSHHHHAAPAAAATTATTAVQPLISTTKLERRLLGATAAVAPASPRTTSNELRYLTFGSSITWGVGLEEPTVSAYPYLLSPLVHNAGMKNNNNDINGSSNNSNGAVLAAACTQSIVQDGVYDVVVLEYSIVDEAVVLLAQRLRRRFPHATLILLRLQGDASAILSTTSRQQLPAGLDAHVLDLTSLPSSLTHFQSNTNSDSSSSLQPEGDDVALSLSSAHADVARAIRALVESLHVTRHVDDDDHVLGDWNNVGGGGDYCNLWYDNGAFMETSSTRRLRPVEFTPLHPQQETESTSSSSWTSLFFQDDEDIHKHALELDTSSSSSSSGSTSSIRIQNPFSTPRMLYLSYLTTSTELDNDDATPGGTSLIYPHLRVRINGKPSVLLESWHSIACREMAANP